jgi:hypothetical protein
MYKSLLTYSTGEPGWVALKLKLGVVLPMKDLFVKLQLLETDLSLEHHLRDFNINPWA